MTELSARNGSNASDLGRLLAVALALGSTFGLVACGSDTTPPLMTDGGLIATTCPGAGCILTATGASCTSGYACTIPSGGSQTVDCGAMTTCAGTCGDSCNVDCTMGATCTVTTGASSSSSCDMATCVITGGESLTYDCTNGADCDVTMGAGSSASCDTGSTCDFVCTDTCGVSCSEDSVCTVQCPADTEPRSFMGEVSCE